jgi:hypothetical protein
MLRIRLGNPAIVTPAESGAGPWDRRRPACNPARATETVAVPDAATEPATVTIAGFLHFARNGDCKAREDFSTFSASGDMTYGDRATGRRRTQGQPEESNR